MNFETPFGDYGYNLHHGISLITDKYAYSTRHRKVKSFERFAHFVQDLYGTLTSSNAERIVSHFRSYTYSERGENSVVTAHSDYSAWASLMRDLVQAGYLPACAIPKGLPSNHKLIKNSTIIPCLGTMNPNQWKDELRNKDLPNLQALDDHDYLAAFISSQLEHRGELVNLARIYIQEAAHRFQQGRKYIQETCPSMFENDSLLHPASKANKSRQHLSLFSDKLPKSEGLRNLVGFLYHKRNGLLRRNFNGANNHLYRFGGRVSLQEHLGLSSNLAAACAIIIVSETGMNPESLYRLNFDPNDKMITPHDHIEAYFLKYYKARAGGPVNRLIPRSPETINTEFCFNLIEATTEDYRTLASTKIKKSLFIHDGCNQEGLISALSMTGFKSAFQRLVSMSTNNDFILSKPNLSKLRVTGGILAWYESGGDHRAASRYLGNTPEVAIKNYIPKELQEFFYRRKIRQFQHLLIAIATDRKTYQKTALNIKTTDDLESYLTSHVYESDFYKRVKNVQLEDTYLSRSNSKFTFLISESNIAFLQAARENHRRHASKNIPIEITKWSNIANIIFQYIRLKGTREQKRILAKGIEQYRVHPIQLDMTS